ncbi:MAG: hypothetical protein ACK559_28495, partial [bacterium]
MPAAQAEVLVLRRQQAPPRGRRGRSLPWSGIESDHGDAPIPIQCSPGAVCRDAAASGGGLPG